MQALIIAAGFGSRLLPLTQDQPKAMVKIWGVPIIERILFNLKKVGVSSCVIVTGYKGNIIRKHLGNNYKGIKLIYKHNPLGKEGLLTSVVKAYKIIKERFIFVCGDTIPYPETLKKALSIKGDSVVGVIKSREKDSIHADVERDGRVKAIGMNGEIKKWNRVVTGIAVYEPSFLSAVNTCCRKKQYDRPHALQEMLKKKQKMYSFDMTNEPWVEIDDHETLKSAEKEVFKQAWETRFTPRTKGFLFRRIFNFPISLRLTKIVAKTNITPNQITIFTLILFIIAGIFLGYGNFILGGILSYVAVLFDAVDGKISRLKQKSSKYGAYLDSLVDRTSEFSVIAGLTIGINNIMAENYVILIGFIAAFGWLGRFYLKQLFIVYKDKKTFDSFWIPRITDFRDRDLSMFITMVLCIIGRPLIALVYLAIVPNMFFFLRIVQTLKYLYKND